MTIENTMPESTELETIDTPLDDAAPMRVLGGAEMGVLAEIRDMVSGAPSMYSSIDGKSFEDRKKTLEALTNSKPIAEHIGKKIELENIIVQVVTMTDEKTGESSQQPRVILIDNKGTAYHGISRGLFLAIRNIIGVVGEPKHWPSVIPIVVKREKARIGSFFTIELAG